MKKQCSNIILVVALILSHFVVYKIEIGDSILLKGIKFKIFPLIDFAGNESTNLVWFSVIIGYMLFCFYLLLNLRKVERENAGFFYSVLIICTGAFLFECFAIWKIYTGDYAGQHSRIGLILFFLCLSVNNIIYKSQITLPAKAELGNQTTP